MSRDWAGWSPSSLGRGGNWGDWAWAPLLISSCTLTWCSPILPLLLYSSSPPPPLPPTFSSFSLPCSLHAFVWTLGRHQWLSKRRSACSWSMRGTFLAQGFVRTPQEEEDVRTGLCGLWILPNDWLQRRTKPKSGSPPTTAKLNSPFAQERAQLLLWRGVQDSYTERSRLVTPQVDPVSSTLLKLN